MFGRGVVKEQAFVSRWVLVILQFHIAIPYFYGGVARSRLTGCWGSQWGFIWSPRRIGHLSALVSVVLGRSVVLLRRFVFDLAIVRYYIWKRTRMLAFLAAVCIPFEYCRSVQHSHLPVVHESWPRLFSSHPTGLDGFLRAVITKNWRRLDC